MKTEVWGGSIVRSGDALWASAGERVVRPRVAESARSGRGRGPGEALFEEVQEEGPGVSLRFMLDRSRRAMRIYDFRAGASPAKRARAEAVAVREGMVKIFTVVERDEIPTWTALGYEREASLPAFYKRTDAFVLGKRAGVSIRYLPDGDDVETSTGQLHPDADATMDAAKLLAKELRTAPVRPTKLTTMDLAAARKAVAAATKAGTALTALAPFGRDGVREYWMAPARPRSVVLSVESQPCFGSAFIEVLQSPQTSLERAVVPAAVVALIASLTTRAFASAFTLVPVHDVELAAVFIAQGFRRTGVLRSHMVVARRRTDAVVLARKLPGAES